MPAAIHLLIETVQSLSAAAREICPLRAGRPVHPTALSRWAKHGVKTPAGTVTLETVHLAGRVVTSREAVQRFFRRVAEAKSGPPVPALAGNRTPESSGPRQAEAKRSLDRIGI